MARSLLDLYAEAATDRCRLVPGEGHRWVRSAGVRGLVAAAPEHSRLVVTTDEALDRLTSLVAGLLRATVTVADSAPGSAALLRTDPSWGVHRTTAMVRPDLGGLAGPDLPGGLALEAVDRSGAGPSRLDEAVRVADRAEPLDPLTAEGLAVHLRSLPGRVRLWVALDGGGHVVATSGTQLAGTTAYVLFVNTLPEWRRRGVGAAMTRAALAEAGAAGATRAVLDASDAGVGPYRRVGFLAAGRVTRFTRS